MKPRQHRSFSAAITYTMGVLTDIGAGEAVGKTASLVRKWSDPDDAALPSIQQSIDMDKAMIAEGYKPAIHEAYTRQLAALGIDVIAGDILLAALGLQSACGLVSEAVTEAKSPHGHGGHTITQKEREATLKALDKARDKLNEIEAALNEETGVRAIK